MRVILLQDVKKVGKKGQTVDVSDGYAANFLFPRKLAVKETKKSVEILEQQNEDVRVAKEKAKEEALRVKAELEKVVLEMTLKANNGKVFGSISFKQIEDALREQFNIIIDKRKIITKDPVNKIGYSRLEIELYKGVIGIITVHVSEEK
ncbi:MAG: 50S ribosomal protein L9 [Bacilli bacterium]|nr:50S ribosomal protein L9 [Bacilli bacterium]